MFKHFLSYSIIIIVVLVCFIPSYAYANAATPMLFMTLGLMVLALLPIFLIEAFIYRSFFNAKYIPALLASFSANLVSTIIGIPLSSIITSILGGITNTPSLEFVEHGGSDSFLIMVVAQLVPAFFVSVLMEYFIVKRFFKSFDKAVIKQAVWKANIVTYSLLITLFLVPWLRKSLPAIHSMFAIAIVVSTLLLVFFFKKVHIRYKRALLSVFISIIFLAIVLADGVFLGLASERNNIGLAKFLIKAGSNVDANMDGKTPLMKASENGHMEIVRLLIESGADVNNEGRRGHTALMSASSGGHSQIANLLIEKGADVNAKYSGMSISAALSLALENKHPEIVKILKKAGAK